MSFVTNAVSDVVGAITGKTAADASNNAVAAQSAATDKALALQQQEYNQAYSDAAPYRDIALAGVQQYARELGLNAPSSYSSQQQPVSAQQQNGSTNTDQNSQPVQQQQISQQPSSPLSLFPGLSGNTSQSTPGVSPYYSQYQNFTNTQQAAQGLAPQNQVSTQASQPVSTQPTQTLGTTQAATQPEFTQSSVQTQVDGVPQAPVYSGPNVNLPTYNDPSSQIPTYNAPNQTAPTATQYDPNAAPVYQQVGLNNYQDSPAYQNALQAGESAIDRQSPVYASGSRLKNLLTFNQGLADQYRQEAVNEANTNFTNANTTYANQNNANQQNFANANTNFSNTQNQAQQNFTNQNATYADQANAAQQGYVNQANNYSLAQNNAQQNFQNANTTYGNQVGQYDAARNRLANLLGIGQTQQQITNAAGSNFANNSGTLITNQGDNSASGILGASNAQTSAINNLLGNISGSSFGTSVGNKVSSGLSSLLGL